MTHEYKAGEWGSVREAGMRDHLPPPETNAASAKALEWCDEAIAIRDNIRAANAEIARLKAQAKAATIYLEGVGGDFPDFQIAVTNALLLLSGAVA